MTKDSKAKRMISVPSVFFLNRRQIASDQAYFFIPCNWRKNVHY